MLASPRDLRRVTLAVLILAGLVASLPLVLGADHRSRLLALNSLGLALGSAAIAVPVGSWLALLVARTNLLGRRMLAVLLGMMLLVPLFLQAAAWLSGFGIQGWYSLAFSRLGVPALLSGWRGAIWIHGMAAIPWVTLIVGIAVRDVQPELEEAALLDASPGVVFRRVTLRRAMPAIVAAALWVLVTTAGEMTVTNLLLIRTYAEEVYTGFALGDDPLAEAPLTVLPGVAVVVWLVVAAMVVCGQLVPRDDRDPTRQRVIFKLGRWYWPATVFTWGAVMLLVGVPVGSLVYKAGIVVEQEHGELVRSWSISKAVWIVATSLWDQTEPLGWSLLLGVLAATSAVLIAIPLVWMASKNDRRALMALVPAAICLAIPGPIVALGLIAALNRPQFPTLIYLYDRTIFAPLAALVIKGFPVALLVTWHALRGISPESLESAATDGAGPMTQLWRVALPQRWPAVAGAWLVTLAVSMADVSTLATMILVAPPRVYTLAQRIFDDAHYGVDDRLAGMCLASMLLFALVAVLVLWLMGDRRYKRQDQFDRQAKLGP